jgi:hypothetical protein
MLRTSFVFRISVLFTIVAFYGVASAATRTVCLELRFKDNRNSAQCATTGETGNLRGCSPGNDMNHRGAILELWDKDSDGSDEMIGRFSYWHDGGTCWTFEWENSSAAQGEANPDVYAKWVNEVFGPQNSRSAVAKRQDGSSHNKVTWRDGVPGDPNRYIASECQTGGACWIFPSGWLLPSGDANTETAGRAMALDSAQHALEQFSGIMTSNITIRMPDTSCPTGCVWTNQNRTLIRIPGNLMRDGLLVAHEVGHTVQAQMFGINNLRDDCSQSGAGWGMTSAEFDSCATTEGFATYAALASWYDGGTIGTQPIGWGFNFENATPQSSTCASNRAFALQVAKAFWDFDDINNEPAHPVAGTAADREAWFPWAIADAWRLFPPERRTARRARATRMV